MSAPPPCSSHTHHDKVDIHCHVMPPPSFYAEVDWFEALGRKGTIVTVQDEPDGSVAMYKSTASGRHLFRPSLDQSLFDPAARLREMDAYGTEVQVMSIVPVMWAYWLDGAEEAGRWTRALNAAVLDQTVRGPCPSRLLGMGAVPLQHPELAATILEECHAAGLKAIQIPTHVPRFSGYDDLSTHTGLRYELGDTRFEPFFKRAAELGMPIFVHPWYMSYFDQEDRMTEMPGGKEIAGKGAHWAPWLVGMPAEEANCMLQIMASGLLHKYPALKICVSHGSGAFPCVCGRIKRGVETKPEWVWPTHGNYFASMGETERTDTVETYLRRNFWADSLTLDAHGLGQILRLYGIDKVCFGTDFPFPLGNVAEPEGIPDDDPALRRMILRDNALAFLGLLPPQQPASSAL